MISRNYARSQGIKRYYTGKPCKNGNVADRLTSTGNCLCHSCRYKKNSSNNNYYHSIKTETWFVEKSREYRRKMRKEKSEYDREYRHRTIDKQKEWSRDWVKKNPEKRKAISQNYKHRRRSWESGGVSTQELIDWSDSQEKVCYWCGVSCEQRYHIDHYFPLSRGGLHEIENLVIACPKCNQTKSAKDPYDFAKEKGRLF